VVRDKEPLDGAIGTPADEADRRRGTEAVRFVAAAARSCADAHPDTRLHRLAASSPLSWPVETISGIPCTASLLLDPSRTQRRLDPDRDASRPPSGDYEPRVIAKWHPGAR